MFGKTWVCGCTFSTVNFMKSKYRSSFSDENLMSQLSCAGNVKYTLGFGKSGDNEIFLINIFNNIFPLTLFKIDCTLNP